MISYEIQRGIHGVTKTQCLLRLEVGVFLFMCFGVFLKNTVVFFSLKLSKEVFIRNSKFK